MTLTTLRPFWTTTAGKSIAIAVLLTLLVACGGASENPTPPPTTALGGNILVDGSSTVYPVTEAMAEEFMAVNRNVRVTVGISGTGGGFSKFCNNETDVSDASRPISSSERERCTAAGIEYIELPVAYDGLAVMVNPANTWVDCLTVAELRTIWEPAAEGAIKSWDQVRPTFPDRPLNLYGPGVDSGTYDYFVEVISGGSSRGDFQASEDDNVLVQGIATDQGAIGFFGLAYYEENRDKLKLVAVDDEKPDNGDGCIAPSPETVEGGTYRPLSRPILIYVKRSSADRPEVNAFLNFYLNTQNARELVTEVGYIPFADQVYSLARQRWENRRTGSTFSGQLATMSVAELLQR